MKRKLSTGLSTPAKKQRKRKGKRNIPPTTPIKRKGRVKNPDGVLTEPILERARARAGACASACGHARKRAGTKASLNIAIDEALDIAAAAFNASAADRKLWAAIAWRIGAENFYRAVKDKQSEDRAERVVLNNPAAGFQAFLNRHFPKLGPGSTSRGSQKGGAE